MIRTILSILFFLFLTIAQISVLPQVGAQEFLLLPLPVLLLALEFWPRPTAYAASITAAVSLSIFATQPLEAYLLAFVGTTLFAEALYGRFFTNRSFYGTVVLTLLASVIFESLLLLATLIATQPPSVIFSDAVTHLWHRAAGNTLAQAILFLTFLGIGHAVRSRFVIRGSHAEHT